MILIRINIYYSREQTAKEDSEKERARRRDRKRAHVETHEQGIAKEDMVSGEYEREA